MKEILYLTDVEKILERDWQRAFIEPRGSLAGPYNNCWGVGPGSYIKGVTPLIVKEQYLQKYPLYFHVGRFVYARENSGLLEAIPLGFDTNQNKFYDLINRQDKIATNNLFNKVFVIVSFWQIFYLPSTISLNIPYGYRVILGLFLEPGDIFAIPFSKETIVLDADFTPGGYWRLSEIGTVTAGSENDYMGIIWGLIDGRRIWLMYAPFFEVKER
ncbi:MAG: hypothetical protein QXI58_01130 [Candidatus Micrarchaeia archaeon]